MPPTVMSSVDPSDSLVPQVVARRGRGCGWHRVRRLAGWVVIPLALVAPIAAAASEPVDDQVSVAEDDDWVDLHVNGVHLTVDFTPAWHQVFPPEIKPEVPLVEDTGDGHPTLKVHLEEQTGGGSLSFFVLPDIRYNPDEGLGMGLAIPLIWSEPDVDPYKYSFVVQLVASTKLVQDHSLIFDLVEMFGLPLRLSGQTGFYAFGDEPFCGIGSTASCDPERAEAAALGETTPGAQARIEHYFLMRLLRAYAWGVLRWELFDLYGKWEVFGGWRSELYIPGFFGNVLGGELFEAGPYPGSVLAQRDPTGEPGVINMPQLGIMVDTRDFEPSPRTGYWLEASIRGAHPLALSSWGFGGGNVTGRFYVPLLPSKTLTLANRVVADVIVGDAPVQELARFGGSTDYRGFGGRWVGRGLRQQRFIGNVKLAYQSELRWDAIRFDVAAFSIGFEFVAFLDAGLVLAEGVDYVGVRPTGVPLRALLAGGFGLRWVINKNIVIRADIGFSPDAGMLPQFYFDGRHIF